MTINDEYETCRSDDESDEMPLRRVRGKNLTDANGIPIDTADVSANGKQLIINGQKFQQRNHGKGRIMGLLHTSASILSRCQAHMVHQGTSVVLVQSSILWPTTCPDMSYSTNTIIWIRVVFFFRKREEKNWMSTFKRTKIKKTLSRCCSPPPTIISCMLTARSKSSRKNRPIARCICSVQGTTAASPCLFVWTQSRTQLEYEDVWRTVVFDLAPALKEVAPLYVTTDFEVAHINAIWAVLPNAEMVGCFSHFKQAIFNWIKRNHTRLDTSLTSEERWQELNQELSGLVLAATKEEL